MEPLTQYIPLLMLVILVMSIVSLIIFLVAYLKFAKLNNHLSEMLSDSGMSLPGLVEKYLETTATLQAAQDEQARRLSELEGWKALAVQRVALKRYNAFDGVGGDQSFSLALLKGNGEGVVLSGLYGREETRVYAKPIQKGDLPYPLSEEERETVSVASQGKDQ